jgi:hypothetical protein
MKDNTWDIQLDVWHAQKSLNTHNAEYTFTSTIMEKFTLFYSKNYHKT